MALTLTLRSKRDWQLACGWSDHMTVKSQGGAADDHHPNVCSITAEPTVAAFADLIPRTLTTAAIPAAAILQKTAAETDTGRMQRGECKT